MNFWIIVYLAYNFVIMLSIERFMSAIFEKRRTPLPVAIGSYLLYFVLSSLAFLLLNVPEITALTGVLTAFIIALNYQSPMRKRIVAVAFLYIIIISIKVFATIPFSDSAINLFGGFDANIHAFVIVAILTYATTLLMGRFEDIRKDTIPFSMFWTASAVITTTLLVVLVLAVIYLPSCIAAIATVMIFTTNLFNSYIHNNLATAYDDLFKLMLSAREKEYYVTQCQLMQQAVGQIKSIRHDMKLHLAMVKNYTENNKAKEATDYLNTILGEINKNGVFSDTGNLAFDSIINFKLNNVQDDHIRLEIQSLIPPALNIEVADIIIILGNLLDNAIEAVQRVEDKTIKLDIVFDRKSLFIKVDNTFDGVVEYEPEKADGKKRIATRKSGDDHGYGLENIKRSIEKYNGQMDITHEGDVFSVAIILYLDDV